MFLRYLSPTLGPVPVDPLAPRQRRPQGVVGGRAVASWVLRRAGGRSSTAGTREGSGAEWRTDGPPGPPPPLLPASLRAPSGRPGVLAAPAEFIASPRPTPVLCAAPPAARDLSPAPAPDPPRLRDLGEAPPPGHTKRHPSPFSPTGWEGEETRERWSIRSVI